MSYISIAAIIIGAVSCAVITYTIPTAIHTTSGIEYVWTALAIGKTINKCRTIVDDVATAVPLLRSRAIKIVAIVSIFAFSQILGGIDVIGACAILVRMCFSNPNMSITISMVGRFSYTPVQIKSIASVYAVVKNVYIASSLLYIGQPLPLVMAKGASPLSETPFC